MSKKDLVMQNPNTVTVIFEEGFKRGNEVITEVELTRPKTGALRGLSLAQLLQLDVNSLAKLSPRITSPTMNENDVYELSPADFTAFGKEVIGFFVTAEV